MEPDRDRFFGRASDADIVAEWWQANRLTFMVGHPGCGKTSLLHGGVLPVLAGRARAVLPVGRLTDGVTFPAAALPPHNPYTLALLRSWSPGETPTRLAGLTIREFVKRRSGTDAVLAAIDPADELLADAGPRRIHRRAFLGELSEALHAEPRLHLLVVGRAEAVGVVAHALGSGARHEVKALSRPGAVEAVVRPIAGSGASFADGAAETLVTDLQTSCLKAGDGAERYVTDDRVEPALLQVACAWLWDRLPADIELITSRDVRRYGDPDTALATHCGSLIARVADEHDISARRLSSWLLRTFVTELGTRGRAYEGATATAGMPNSVARALEDLHLLSARPVSGARWYELLSDRLIEPLRNAPAMRPAAKPADYLWLAGHALTLGELDRAERYLEEIGRDPLSLGPRLRAQACSLRGNLAYECEKPKEAEARYQEAAQLYAAAGDSTAVAYELAAAGQCQLAQGRVTDAVEELHAAVRRLPSDIVLRTQLAQALWQAGQGAAAVAILNDVLRADGGNPAALAARGEILAYLGEARQAMLDLDRVTSQGPPSARAARAVALAGLGDQRAARRELENAVVEGRRNGMVLLYAARASALGGDEIAAREYARQAADATDPPLSPWHRAAARQLTAEVP